MVFSLKVSGISSQILEMPSNIFENILYQKNAILQVMHCVERELEVVESATYNQIIHLWLIVFAFC